jgi:PhoH-like ATPase
MRKNFVLDTNILLHDPQAIFTFAEHNVVVPIYVIEEIDQFKRDLSELGRNARASARHLDQFRQSGNLGTGVPLPGGGTIRVLFSSRNLPKELGNGASMDNKILAVALDLREKEPECPVTFVTKDTNLRIRADALGLHAEDYDAERVEISEVYPGFSEQSVPGAVIDAFYASGEAEVGTLEDGSPRPPNEFVVMKDEANPNHSAVARWSAERRRALPLVKLPREGVWGIRPRNKEQAFALDLLLDDQVRLVTLVGKAGTGKTMLAIAAGLAKTMEESIYHRLLVSRPIFPLGRDLGYLPGDVEEKLNPWMQPIFDNVEFLMNLSRADKKAGRGYHELMDLGVLAIEPLTYIRGRSIPSQFIIVDEAQNLTPHEVKTIITRVGEGTKIVLTGDPYQIDNPYVDSTNNGLIHALNKFKNEPIAGHVTLTKGERSQLAELAANLL